MARFIIITFIFLGWVFYEMSGGAEFDPEATRLARIELPVAVEQKKLDKVVPTVAVQSQQEDVTRVSLNLTSVNDVLRPSGNLRTTSAKVTPAVEKAVAEALSEEEPTIVLPSLINNTAVITPVKFTDEDQAEQQTQQVDQSKDVRAVTGSSVNVRGGPGTNYSVVNRLVRGDQVEILQDPGNGWVKLRPVGGGTVGWMADFLLSKG
jgi:SH3 domain-containing protein